ncbi:MAG: hypothetical protein LBI54_06900 [Lachnospiraceae bacterium]|jgi:hypothetical protein|nr:hypothetical protein [Lachnospiraceae bacterium]
MPNKEFPRTVVGGVSLPRLIIGSNLFFGWTHQTTSADSRALAQVGSPDAIAGVVGAFLEYNIDAVVAPMMLNPAVAEGIKLAEERAGKPVILIDTPIIDIADNKAARERAEAEIKRTKERGAAFCFLHHSSVEQLVDKEKKAIHRLPDYLEMIRMQGMVPGLSAHMPEVLLFSDIQGYDVESYMQIYNCMGYLMQIEIENSHKIIYSAKKPVMTMKAMAAGRCTPFVGLTFSYATIRDCDMVAVGCQSPGEVHEDVEISLAAIERRSPEIKLRNSPSKTVLFKE